MTVASPLLTGNTTTQAQSLASSAASSSSTTSSTTTASTNSLSNMDSFLTLFLTQLQYQDPTNPMESYELASQLAQFSTVEQLSKVNSNLELTQALLTSVNNAQMVDMLGRQVTGFYDSMQVKDGTATNGQFELDETAASVTVNILNESGAPIRTITLGATEAGRHDIGWDGKDADGATVPDGTYTFEVEATDAEGESLGVTQTVSGKVFAFVIDNGTPYLILDSADGLRLPINTVMEVQESTTA